MHVLAAALVAMVLPHPLPPALLETSSALHCMPSPLFPFFFALVRIVTLSSKHKTCTAIKAFHSSSDEFAILHKWISWEHSVVRRREKNADICLSVLAGSQAFAPKTCGLRPITDTEAETRLFPSAPLCDFPMLTTLQIFHGGSNICCLYLTSLGM